MMALNRREKWKGDSVGEGGMKKIKKSVEVKE